jgi:hypothetical protein
MSPSPLSGLAGPLCLTAAVLIVLSQLLRLGVGRVLGPDSASTVAHTATYALALVGMAVLLLALTAVYVTAAPALGRLGLAGFLTAFLGTLLVAGDWWFEAFVVPTIATHAPAILITPPTGSVVAGALITAAFFTAGWTLLGIAAFRARVFGRPAAVALTIAGLAGVLTLWTPWQIPLALVVGWIGLVLRGRSPSQAVRRPAAIPRSPLPGAGTGDTARAFRRLDEHRPLSQHK